MALEIQNKGKFDKTHTVRTRDGKTITLTYSRPMAIRLFCTECFGWTGNPKTDCTDAKCPLYPWRGRTRATGAQAEEGDGAEVEEEEDA